MRRRSSIARTISLTPSPRSIRSVHANCSSGLSIRDIRGIALTRRPHREDVLVARLTELANRIPEAATRLRELCDRDLPELNRHILSKIMDWLGTPEALAANLNLIENGGAKIDHSAAV